ncbi:MAG: peptidylprolyl isomerase [Phycisphaerae bacterium]|nr:peptidylprolyl isomerase [Phycisphaerae bacterium]
MKWLIGFVGVWWCLCPAVLYADSEDAADAASPAATTAPTSAPASEEKEELPEGPEGLLATVGETEIQVQDLATILDKIPYKLSPKKRREIWYSNLDALIYSALLHSYLEEIKAPDAPDELAELKDKLAKEVEMYNKTASLRLRTPITEFELMEQRGLNDQRLADQARYAKLMGVMLSNEELWAFMNKHPDYFDGTTAHVGHILIECSPLTPTEKQKRIKKQLESIAADIQSGKITFAEAAQKYSQCPSGQMKGFDGTADYGDLGNRFFYELAVMFGAAVGAAALDGEVGTLSDVVRSPRGFHLVKIFGRAQGDQQRSTESAGIAQMAVKSLVENQIMQQALERAPIQIFKASQAIPKPKKD